MTDFVEPRDRDAAAGGSLGLAAIGQQLANSPHNQAAALQPSDSVSLTITAAAVPDPSAATSGADAAGDANVAPAAKLPATPQAGSAASSQTNDAGADTRPTAQPQVTWSEPAASAQMTSPMIAGTSATDAAATLLAEVPTKATVAAPSTTILSDAAPRLTRKTTTQPKGGKRGQQKAAPEKLVEIVEPVTEASVQKAINLADARREALVERLDKFAAISQSYLKREHVTGTMLINQANTVIRDIVNYEEALELAAARKKAFAGRQLSETFSTVMSSLGIDAVAVHESAREGNRPLADILIEVMLEAKAKQQQTAGDRWDQAAH